MKMIKVNVNDKRQMIQLERSADEGKAYKNYECTLKVFGYEHMREVAKQNKKVFIKHV